MWLKIVPKSDDSVEGRWIEVHTRTQAGSFFTAPNALAVLAHLYKDDIPVDHRVVDYRR